MGANEINKRISALLEGEKFKKSSDRNQKALAAFIGVPFGTLSQWLLKNRDIPARHIKPIADFFEVSTDYLLGKTDSKEPVYALGIKNYDQHLRLVENSEGAAEMNNANDAKLERMAIYAFVIEDRYEHIQWLCTEIVKIIDDESLSVFLESIHVTSSDFDAWMLRSFRRLPASWQLNELLNFYCQNINYTIGHPAPIVPTDPLDESAQKAYQAANRLMNEAADIRRKIPNIQVVDRYVQNTIPIIVKHLESNEKDAQIAKETTAREKAERDAIRRANVSTPKKSKRVR